MSGGLRLKRSEGAIRRPAGLGIWRRRRQIRKRFKAAGGSGESYSPVLNAGGGHAPGHLYLSLYKIPANLLRKAGRKPLGDVGAGEGVGEAEVEVLLEVREGVRMEDEGTGGLGRKDTDEVCIGLDKVQ